MPVYVVAGTAVLTYATAGQAVRQNTVTDLHQVGFVNFNDNASPFMAGIADRFVGIEKVLFVAAADRCGLQTDDHIGAVCRWDRCLFDPCFTVM